MSAKSLRLCHLVSPNCRCEIRHIQSFWHTQREEIIQGHVYYGVGFGGERAAGSISEFCLSCCPMTTEEIEKISKGYLHQKIKNQMLSVPYKSLKNAYCNVFQKLFFNIRKERNLSNRLLN